VLGVSRAMALPVPGLARDALSRAADANTATGLLYALLPANAIAAVLRFVVARTRGRATRLDRLHAAVSVAALAVLPQALHRCSVHHLLQVLPLLSVAATVTIARVRAVVPRVGLVASVGVVLWALRPFWAVDLTAFRTDPARKFRALARGLDAGGDAPAAAACRFIRAHTSARDTVLSLSQHSELLFFTGRRTAGYLTAYVPGLLTTDAWQARNLAQIVRDDPAFVILVDEPPIDGRPENAIPAYLPVLWAHIERTYPEVAFRAGSIVVRGRATAALTASGGRIAPATRSAARRSRRSEIFPLSATPEPAYRHGRGLVAVPHALDQR
jgi:hypothetical protein